LAEDVETGKRKPKINSENEGPEEAEKKKIHNFTQKKGQSLPLALWLGLQKPGKQPN